MAFTSLDKPEKQPRDEQWFSGNSGTLEVEGYTDIGGGPAYPVLVKKIPIKVGPLVGQFLTPQCSYGYSGVQAGIGAGGISFATSENSVSAGQWSLQFSICLPRIMIATESPNYYSWGSSFSGSRFSEQGLCTSPGIAGSVYVTGRCHLRH